MQEERLGGAGRSSLRLCLVEELNLWEWIPKNLSRLCVNKRVVWIWINGWMVRLKGFEGIVYESLE